MLSQADCSGERPDLIRMLATRVKLMAQGLSYTMTHRTLEGMVLKLEEAQRIMAAAMTKAEEFDVKISVAICDAGGRIVAFSRMDGAGFGGFYGAAGKAIASACFRRPSAAIDPSIKRFLGMLALLSR